MDERLDKAIKLINECVSDPEMFIKFLELGQMLNISEARDLLEQVSAALSDEVFYDLVCRIEDRELSELLDDETELEPCALPLEQWDDHMDGLREGLGCVHDFAHEVWQFCEEKVPLLVVQWCENRAKEAV